VPKKEVLFGVFKKGPPKLQKVGKCFFKMKGSCFLQEVASTNLIIEQYPFQK
jgi:hypothetical protein